MIICWLFFIPFIYENILKASPRNDLSISIETRLRKTDIPFLKLMKVKVVEVKEGRSEIPVNRVQVKYCLSPSLESQIWVELWLPDPSRWNNRMVGYGNGGSAGRISQSPLKIAYRQGYAAVMTDMGTSLGPDSGVGNSEVWKDFGYRATHLMTTSAKALIHAFYKREAEFSYFVGASTGGQQALQEAQRYPDDYDGIVAMVPAHCRTPLHAYFLWNYQILKACPFNKEQEEAVMNATLKVMENRELPIAANKFVSDPRVNQKVIEDIIVSAVSIDSSISQLHQESLRKLFGGPVHPQTGERIFGGVPIGSSFLKASGHLYLFRWALGADVDLATVDYGTAVDTYTKKLAGYLNAEQDDLSIFRKRNGKLLIVSGTSDSIVPYHATLDYYERLLEKSKSIDELQDYCRFFLIPGKGHGSRAGTRLLSNPLEIVRDWRENNKKPEVLTCQLDENHQSQVIIDIPAYPKHLAIENGQLEQRLGRRGGVERVSKRYRVQ